MSFLHEVASPIEQQLEEMVISWSEDDDDAEHLNAPPPPERLFTFQDNYPEIIFSSQDDPDVEHDKNEDDIDSILVVLAGGMGAHRHRRPPRGGVEDCNNFSKQSSPFSSTQIHDEPGGEQQQRHACGCSSRSSSPESTIAAPLAVDGSRLPKVVYVCDFIEEHMLPTQIQPMRVQGENAAFGFHLAFETTFRKRYYRFDNKILQCFPQCAKFEDVRDARLMGFDHNSPLAPTAYPNTTWCSGEVALKIACPSGEEGMRPPLRLLGRFLAATPALHALPQDAFQGMFSVGATCDASLLARLGAVEGEISPSSCGSAVIHPPLFFANGNHWMLDAELQRHRRRPTERPMQVPTFVFEAVLFAMSEDDSSCTVVARAVSGIFEIASMRTLLRELHAYKRTLEEEEEEKGEAEEEGEADERGGRGEGGTTGDDADREDESASSSGEERVAMGRRRRLRKEPRRFNDVSSSGRR